MNTRSPAMKIRAIDVERFRWERTVPLTDGNATYTM